MATSALVWAALTVLTAGHVLAAPCNPMNTSCAAVPGFMSAVAYDFKGSQNFKDSDWTVMGFPKNIQPGDNGLAFVVSSDREAPTLASKRYLFFGKVEFVVQAAAGQGIVSSVILQSDTNDEIDWEWLGGDASRVQTNYFAKGITGSYNRGGFSNVAAATSSFHSYVIDWNEDRIIWSIDGTPVRTLTVQDALASNNQYPQSPMQVRVGDWCGGCPQQPEGTIEWAGGAANLANGPSVQYIQSIKITPYRPAGSYSFSDKSGNAAGVVLHDGDQGVSKEKNNSTDTSASGASAPAPAPSSAASHASAALSSAAPVSEIHSSNSTPVASSQHTSASKSATTDAPVHSSHAPQSHQFLSSHKQTISVAPTREPSTTSSSSSKTSKAKEPTGKPVSDSSASPLSSPSKALSAILLLLVALAPALL